MKIPHGQPLLRLGQGSYARDVYAVDIARACGMLFSVPFLLSRAGRAFRRAARLFSRKATR